MKIEIMNHIKAYNTIIFDNEVSIFWSCLFIRWYWKHIWCKKMFYSTGSSFGH